MIDLVLGSLQLGDVGGGDASYTISALADDATWGNPAPIEVAVRTLLQNSSSVVTERYDNREAFIRVRIEAPDGVALAEGEEALFAELGRRNLLTYTPSDGFGPPTVFYVITSSMDHALNDLEQLRNWSSYSIRLVCEAFARSVDEVVVEAEFQPVDGEDVPLTPIDTLVDDCTVLGVPSLGWQSPGGTASVSGGSIVTGVQHAPKLTRTDNVAPIDMTSTPYLVMDIKVAAGSPLPRLYVGSSSSYPIASGISPYTGYTRYWYAPGVTSIARFTVQGDPDLLVSSRLEVAEVRKQNTPPTTGTLRQKLFTAEVAGSAPSAGTLEVYHGTDGLGQVLLYTWPQTGGQGFTPALRELQSASGSDTSDPDLVSGASNDLAADDVVYDIPGSQVTTGTYEVGAWLQSDSATTRPVTVTAETVIGSTVVGSTELTKSVDFDATGTWYYVPLGRVELPVNHLPVDTEAIVRVTISSSEASGIDVDEAYLFNLDSGALTVVDCGDSTRVWVNSATLDWPMPSIMVGDDADGSDSYSTGDTVTAWGVHEIKPKSINVFAVTPGALDAGVRLRFTPAWHTHAAS